MSTATATRIPQCLLALSPEVADLANCTLAEAVEVGKLVQKAAAELPAAQRAFYLKSFAELFCANGNVIEQYTFGDCFELSLALRELTGLNVATCHMDCKPSGEAYGCHSFLLLDSVTSLDILGKHSIEDLLMSWEGDMRLACGLASRTQGDSDKPSFSIANDRDLYDEWSQDDISTTSDQHLFAALQVLRAHDIEERILERASAKRPQAV